MAPVALERQASDGGAGGQDKVAFSPSLSEKREREA